VSEPAAVNPHWPQPGDPAPDPGPISARPDDKPKPPKPKLDEAAGGVAGGVLGKIAGTAAGGPVGGFAAGMVGGRIGGAAVRIGKRVLGMGKKPAEDALEAGDAGAPAAATAPEARRPEVPPMPTRADRDPAPAEGPS
jgi:hypothetical protein